MGSEVQPRFVPAQGSDPAGGRWQSEAGFLGLRYLWVKREAVFSDSFRGRAPNFLPKRLIGCQINFSNFSDFQCIKIEENHQTS